MSFLNGAVEWLDKSYLRPHELLSDLAAMNETFVVEGDSLILETIQHEIVDWSGSSGEYLQVAYLVESFLQELLQRGATFRLVFFRLTEVALWSSMPASRGTRMSPQSVLLLRSAVITHLQRNTSIPVDVYDDWNCDAFNTFLSEVRPSFALVSPCTATSSADRIISSTDQGIPISLVMAIMSLKIFSKSVALAFLSELQFKERMIWAESVQPFNLAEHNTLNSQTEKKVLPHLHRVYNAITGTSTFALLDPIDPEFSEINSDTIISTMNPVLKNVLNSANTALGASDTAILDLISSLKNQSVFENASWRYVVSAIAAHYCLKLTKVDKQKMEAVVKAFLVQTVLANHLAPQLRPRSRIAEASAQSSDLHNALSELTVYVARVTQAASSVASHREWDIVDAIDCRLLTSVLSIISKDGSVSSIDALGFPSDMAKELQALWSVAANGNASSLIELSSSTPVGSFLPFSAGGFKIVTADTDAHTPSASNIAPALPIRSTMVNRMIQEEIRPEVKEGDYLRWFNEKEGQRKQVASYPWKASRALDFSTILYYDKEYEERRTNKNYSTSFHAAWAKLAQSLDARPSQTAVLQPKVLMKEEFTAAQILQQLLAKLELENKPKTVLNDARDKEVAVSRTC